MKVRVVAAVLAVGLSACAATSAFGPQTGTVRGHVFLRVCGGPMPVQGTPSPTCIPRPFPSAVVTFEPQAGAAIMTAVTDAAGAYAITLAPGTYTVRTAESPAPAGSSRGIASRMPPSVVAPRTVLVSAGQTVTVDFTVDVELI